MKMKLFHRYDVSPSAGRRSSEEGSGQAEIAYTMDGEDKRKVSVTFVPEGDGVKVTTTFDIEHENPREKQEQGWQAILNNFKKHVESN